MHYKFPRIPHLPWSNGGTRDDLRLIDTSRFEGKRVVVTEKVDGECTSWYRDAIHARSLDSVDHPSRHWVKGLWSKVRHSIPEGWRVCGENLYAVHSIKYTALPSYFLVYAVFDDLNVCQGWEFTQYWAWELGLETVHVLYHGLWYDQIHRDVLRRDSAYRAVSPGTQDFCGPEGYVVRVEEGFPYKEFGLHTAKYVRADHVQTDEHWLDKQVGKNGLAR